METKPSNPKDVLAVRKPRWFSFLPLQVLAGVGLAMLEGAIKYGKHNYRAVGVRASVYVDAAVCGHLMRWYEGEDIDPDSGLSHIDKAIASLMILRDGMIQGNWVDDRPLKGQDMQVFMGDVQDAFDMIIEKYQHVSPVAPFTEKLS